MKIKANRRTLELFEGACVKHALLKYFVAKQLDRSAIDETIVEDEYGHELDHDAPLHENQKIKFKEPEEKEEDE